MTHPLRNILISVFVVIWLVVFNYESTRHFYLEPLVKHSLPKLKFLFPPAGWIMFFNVNDSYGAVEVHGVKDNRTQFIDPHQILQTRAIGYDNINRNVLVNVASADMVGSFCGFLTRKFPYFDNFYVTYVRYPHLSQQPFEKIQKVMYDCR